MFFHVFSTFVGSWKQNWSTAYLDLDPCWDVALMRCTSEGWSIGDFPVDFGWVGEVRGLSPVDRTVSTTSSWSLHHSSFEQNVMYGNRAYLRWWLNVLLRYFFSLEGIYHGEWSLQHNSSHAVCRCLSGGNGKCSRRWWRRLLRVLPGALERLCGSWLFGTYLSG